MSFKEALLLAEAIQTHGAGKPIRRLTLLESLGRSPGSDAVRKLITSSGQYGITEGAYNAEFLSLTPTGAIATDPDYAIAGRVTARFQLAIESIAPFAAIYQQYKNSRLPSVEVLRDAASGAGTHEDHVAECVETFLANAREVGLIRTIAGSEHIVPIEAVLEQTPDDSGTAEEQERNSEYSEPTEEAQAEIVARFAPPPPKTRKLPKSGNKGSHASAFNKTCFVVSPIGSADSVERKHADLVLSSLIEPALEGLGLEVVRADRISKPGLITGQVIEHIAQAALVIADLSFANPNVYYELALRHAVRRPVVQLIRTGDKLPFDVGQYRTVEIDMTDIYVLVPKLDLHRQEITRQARAAMDDGGNTESPLSQFFPAFWDHIDHPEEN
ncbi:hypothetical protein [Homoserinimonas sp. OAct 916]|uniref:hypothetical protein n=1 Tax=Homoserinimonas sp. OAct 916 TaxID=2211450 RepID=UPI0013005115|nr:hypothetical protein [Homoserinimonas sp. OAct 916]